MRRPARIGLTGGIGSGKSTVAAMLTDRGAQTIDADAISRQLTAAGGGAIPAIRQRFGNTLISADGSLDRAAMRSLAFGDSSARQALQDIVHPLVGQEIERQAAAGVAAQAACLVFDIPLLTESAHWRARLERVLVVDCDVATQIARVQARDHWPLADIERAIAAQSRRGHRLACADLVICNQGLDLAALALEVRSLASHFGL